MKVIKDNVKLVNWTMQTLLLKEWIKRNIPLKDVTSIELKQMWNGKGGKDLKLIQFLMKRKLRISQEKEMRKRIKASTAKKKLYGWRNRADVPQGWKVNWKSKTAKEFRSLHRQVVSKVFKDNIERNKKNIKYLKEVRDRSNNPEHVGIVHGVNAGDSELGD